MKIKAWVCKRSWECKVRKRKQQKKTWKGKKKKGKGAGKERARERLIPPKLKWYQNLKVGLLKLMRYSILKIFMFFKQNKHRVPNLFGCLRHLNPNRNCSRRSAGLRETSQTTTRWHESTVLDLLGRPAQRVIEGFFFSNWVLTVGPARCLFFEKDLSVSHDTFQDTKGVFCPPSKHTQKMSD